MADGGPECPGLSGGEAVDQHEAGGVRKVVNQVDPPRHRGPAQGAGKQDDQQQCPPEDRHRIAHQRRAHQCPVKELAPVHRRDHTGGQAQHDRKDHRADRQFERCREKREKLVPDRALCDKGIAQIALQNAGQIIPELDIDGPVKAELPGQFLITFLGQAAFAGHDDDRIARQHADERERDQGDPDEGWNESQQPGSEILQHGRIINSLGKWVSEVQPSSVIRTSSSILTPKFPMS